MTVKITVNTSLGFKQASILLIVYNTVELIIVRLNTCFHKPFSGTISRKTSSILWLIQLWKYLGLKISIQVARRQAKKTTDYLEWILFISKKRYKIDFFFVFLHLGDFPFCLRLLRKLLSVRLEGKIKKRWQRARASFVSKKAIEPRVSANRSNSTGPG